MSRKINRKIDWTKGDLNMREKKLDYLKNKIKTLKQSNISIDEVFDLTGELLDFTTELVNDIHSINSDLKRIEKEQRQLKKEKEETIQLLEYIARLSDDNPQKAIEILETIQEQANKNKFIN